MIPCIQNPVCAHNSNLQSVRGCPNSELHMHQRDCILRLSEHSFLLSSCSHTLIHSLISKRIQLLNLNLSIYRMLYCCWRENKFSREKTNSGRCFIISGIILRKKFTRDWFQVLILRNLMPVSNQKILDKGYVFPCKIEILCVQKHRRDYLK